MNFRKLILSGVLVAVMGFITGCNENPGGNPTGPGTVTGLQATSLSATSVRLQWAANASATSYSISWSPVTAGVGGAGSATSTTNTVDATGLTAGAEYVFTVAAVNLDGTGTGATITWAGANRYTTPSNPQSGVTTIRLYEAESDFPSALNLSHNGAPLLTTLNTTRPAPPAKAQIAMFISPRNGGAIQKIIIGPIYAIPEYALSAGVVSSRIDTNVYISSSTYPVASLDSWFLSGSLASLIDPTSNVKAYEFTTATMTQNQGFVVRVGAGTSADPYHYAKVLIKNVAGSMISGTGSNRYVELEISYQAGNNVPYAKPGQRPTSTVGGVVAKVIK